jgi:hypothetical protein
VPVDEQKGNVGHAGLRELNVLGRWASGWADGTGVRRMAARDAEHYSASAIASPGNDTENTH